MFELESISNKSGKCFLGEGPRAGRSRERGAEEKVAMVWMQQQQQQPVSPHPPVPVSLALKQREEPVRTSVERHKRQENGVEEEEEHKEKREEASHYFSPSSLSALVPTSLLLLSSFFFPRNSRRRRRLLLQPAHLCFSPAKMLKAALLYQACNARFKRKDTPRSWATFFYQACKKIFGVFRFFNNL